jgi:type IV pilus assembly protein PilV
LTQGALIDMCRRAQNGFTLAEVLASVFLLALGVVGAAGMQLQALRTAQQSAFQTASLSLATEMADALRMSLAASDAHPLLEEYLRLDFRSWEHASASTANCYLLPCSPSEFAEFNIGQWSQRFAAALPDARAKICLDMQSTESGSGRPGWTCRSPASLAERGKAAIIIKIGWRDKAQMTAHDTSTEQKRNFPPRLVLAVAPYVQ